MNLLPVLKEFTYWEYLAFQEIADFTFQQLLLIAVVTSIQLEFKNNTGSSSRFALFLITLSTLLFKASLSLRRRFYFQV